MKFYFRDLHSSEKSYNFASQIRGTAKETKPELEEIAKIAQLVEHDLAKVGVAGSSPVFRSISSGW